MTQIEQIKAEIERLKGETCIGISEYDKGVENGRMEVLNTLLKLIDLQKRQDEQEYHKIGEAFEFEGHKLMTIKSKESVRETIRDCIVSCFFSESGRCDCLACCKDERIDKNNVYFLEVDKKGGAE